MPQRRGRSRRAALSFWKRVVAPVLLVGFAGCTDDLTTGSVAFQPSVQRVAASLTSDVAARLDASGKFKLERTAPAGPYPEISEEQANALARAWARQYGGRHATFLQELHGAPINFQQLTPCGRTLYSRSSFQAPRPDVPLPSRRPYGPWWLTTLCSPGGTPQVSLAVSAWATDIRIADGKIVFPFHYGGEFFPLGIPIGHTGEYPISPEAAVTLLAEATGRRVAEMPELVVPSPDNGPPQGARWLLRLDRSAAVRTGGSAEVQADRFFVGQEHMQDRGAVALLGTSTQPSSLPIYWATVPSPGENEIAYQGRRRILTAEALRRADTPLRFERVNVAGGR